MATQDSSPVGASKGLIRQYTWTGSLSLEMVRACFDLAGVMSPGPGFAGTFGGILVRLNIQTTKERRQ